MRGSSSLCSAVFNAMEGIRDTSVKISWETVTMAMYLTVLMLVLAEVRLDFTVRSSVLRRL